MQVRGALWGMGALAAVTAQAVYAEGSYQAGLNQPLYDFAQAGNLLYVDVLAAGEVINVSLCGNADNDDIQVRIFDPSNNEVLNTSRTSGTVSCADPFSGQLTNPIRHTTTTAGTYSIQLENANGNKFNRFDVSITPNAGTNPDPTVAAGRLWAKTWSYLAASFALGDATNANYFPLVPGGRANTHYVWKLDLNQFAGFSYAIRANDVGVDAPNSGYSVAMASNGVTAKYPIYLSYPVVAQARPTAPPVLRNVRFIDNAGQDYAISPAVTAGVQDSGNFEFTSDVDGTYAIVIDTNRDSVYGPDDVLLLGHAINGSNQVSWNGRNAQGTVLSAGTYRARVTVRLGEYHFIAEDVETSGGPVAGSGLTIYQANSDGSTTDTWVYWNDATFLAGGSTLPYGALSSSTGGKHTWGTFISASIGNDAYMDTYVYGLNTSVPVLLAIRNSDSAATGTNGSIDAPTASLPGAIVPITVTVTDADLNLSSSVAESVTVEAVNGTTGEIEQIVLTETGANTGIFSGTLTTAASGTAGTSNDGIMNGQIGQALTLFYRDQLDATGAEVDRWKLHYFSAETDGDGVPDTVDIDDDNDGIPDTAEGSGAVDTDGDGVPDSLDLDSDNDGILDVVESGVNAATLDSNGDGRIDVSFAVGINGLANTVETSADSGTPNYTLRDTDSDSTADFRDLDSDADGIKDVIEAGGSDPDSDGRIGSSPVAVNANGVASGAGLTPPDSDGDGVPDYRDNDADNDGVADASDLDDDNDGIPDTAEGSGAVDTDGDGTPDSRDLDSDNDGLFDLAESGANAALLDTNGDGRIDASFPVGTNGLANTVETAADSGTPNYTLRDTDGDGSPDYRDSDTDNDGIVDNSDLDDDNDGIPDTAEGSNAVDTDSDGVPDSRDLDSDNDGILDVVESGVNAATLDTNLDGRIDATFTVGTNGLANAVETAADSGTTNYVLRDTDGDGVRDFRDLDSDNDGISDLAEVGGSDPDANGWIGSGAPPAVDYRGLATGAGLTPPDTDGDGLVDQRDLDADGDGLKDLVEAGGTDVDSNGTVDGFVDVNGNGFADSIAIRARTALPDYDGDGTPDFQDNGDSDADGVPDSADIDDDNDGIPDSVEGSGAVDTDGDGVPDGRDLDSDNDGLFDLWESGANAATLDTNNDGRIDVSFSVGANGLANAVETVADSGATNYTLRNTDGDWVPDFRDLDSDNDGITDVIEAGGSDPDANGRIGSGAPPAVNTNGVAAGAGLAPRDTDSDGVADQRDLDSDNDGIPDLREAGGADNNGDAKVDNFIDANGDGLTDALLTAPLSVPDTDGDATPDYRDTDSDGDGVVDLREAGGTDSNGDGKVDNVTDANGDGLDDGIAVSALPLPDSDGDGVPDYRDATNSAASPRLQTGLNGIGGCTVASGAAFDPLLPALMLGALLYLIRRRHRPTAVRR